MIVLQMQESKCSVSRAGVEIHPARARIFLANCPVIPLPDTTKAGPSSLAGSGFRLMYGDAGIRTRVRLLIHRDVYVRIHPFFSPRPLIGRLEAHREPAVKVSPAPSRRQTRASPNLSTPYGPPQAGLTAEWEVRSP